MSTKTGQARVSIMLVVTEQLEQYEGTILDSKGTVLYTVRRWSENAVRTALMRYLFQTRNAIVDSKASEQLEQLRGKA